MKSDKIKKRKNKIRIYLEPTIRNVKDSSIKKTIEDDRKTMYKSDGADTVNDENIRDWFDEKRRNKRRVKATKNN